MDEILPIEKGNASKIYGLAYYEPKSGYKIAKIIGTQTHHINEKIKELYKQGYLKKIKKKEWRWPKWQSKIKPLITKIENIKKEEKIILSDLDREILYAKLNDKFLRFVINGYIRPDPL